MAGKYPLEDFIFTITENISNEVYNILVNILIFKPANICTLSTLFHTDIQIYTFMEACITHTHTEIGIGEKH